MTHVLRARRLLTEEGWLDDHQLRIADGVIAAIEPIPAGVTERDAELLCPAYIDTHVHGGAGVDVMDDAPDVLDKLAMHKAREGVGSWLPTTVTTPLNTIHAALKRIAQRCQRGGPGAQVLGSYLEGPYFTPQNKGAHPPPDKAFAPHPAIPFASFIFSFNDHKFRFISFFSIELSVSFL